MGPLRGRCTQQEIATELGVSRQAVAKMLGKAEAAFVEKMETGARTVKARDLDRLDHIVREGLRSSERSKRATVKTVEKVAGDGASTTTTRQRTAGDPRYRAIVVEALERQAKMLGLDAPAKTATAITVDRALEGVSGDELRRELVEINRQLGLTDDGRAH